MINLPHTQSAHCKSGVVSNLFSQKGIKISEAMACLGIGSGLFFGYLPFIRINGLPLVTYRSAAGHILKRLSDIPGVEIFHKKIRNRDQVIAELDGHLRLQYPLACRPVSTGCPISRRLCASTSMPIIWSFTVKKTVSTSLAIRFFRCRFAVPLKILPGLGLLQAHWPRRGRCITLPGYQSSLIVGHILSVEFMG